MLQRSKYFPKPHSLHPVIVDFAIAVVTTAVIVGQDLSRNERPLLGETARTAELVGNALDENGLAETTLILSRVNWDSVRRRRKQVLARANDLRLRYALMLKRMFGSIQPVDEEEMR